MFKTYEAAKIHSRDIQKNSYNDLPKKKRLL